MSPDMKDSMPGIKLDICRVTNEAVIYIWVMPPRDHEESGMLHTDDQAEATTAASNTFQPLEHTQTPSWLQPPDQQWHTVLATPCTFPPTIFDDVMLNLIGNPNVTSSHLFRADIFYDSERDPRNELRSQLKREYQPREPSSGLSQGYERVRTIVRQLVPRNPQLDRPLVQTCHFFHKSSSDDTSNDEDETNIVLYVPHVTNAGAMPFYHPPVQELAFSHHWQPSCITFLTLSYHLFPSSTITTRLHRTALHLLRTVHKHGQGQLSGYQKRVHLDQLIPQKRYQDTYTRLKTKYGRKLSDQWVEVTDPGKHVFEDVAIAAFLIELWRDLYPLAFPGFVDIGCGNGVLVYLLLSEGYEGWGFDARERKTWKIFPQEVQAKLTRRLLVPPTFPLPPRAPSADTELEEAEEKLYHPGLFPHGTFIISNHADELTTWTPLLAHFSHSAFLAIPCCSHDFSGARFRAPLHLHGTRPQKREIPVRLPQQNYGKSDGEKGGPVAETGSLARGTECIEKSTQKQSQPSAYASLCSYLALLAEAMGYVPEKEVLRIPSTRNIAIVGRKWARSASTAEPASDTHEDGAVETSMPRSQHDGSNRITVSVNGAIDDKVRGEDEDERDKEEDRTMAKKVERVRDLVETEMQQSISEIGAAWIAKVEKLAKKPGCGH